jgi:hypothetical protein
MSNALEAHDHHAQRVARLLAWLQVAFERQEAAFERRYERACNIDNPARLWRMVRNLEHVEAVLKPLLCFVSGVAEAELEQALNDGRPDYE